MNSSTGIIIVITITKPGLLLSLRLLGLGLGFSQGLAHKPYTLNPKPERSFLQLVVASDRARAARFLQPLDLRVQGPKFKA